MSTSIDYMMIMSGTLGKRDHAHARTQKQISKELREDDGRVMKYVMFQKHVDLRDPSVHMHSAQKSLQTLKIKAVQFLLTHTCTHTH